MDRAGNLDQASTSAIPPASYEEKAPVSESSGDSVRTHTYGIINTEQEKEQGVIEGDGEKNGDGERDPVVASADVERVVSKQPSVNNAASIPNGGLWAWLQVLGAFFLFFNSWYVHAPILLHFTGLDYCAYSGYEVFFGR